jgi:hypothetical protein
MNHIFCLKNRTLAWDILKEELRWEDMGSQALNALFLKW